MDREIDSLKSWGLFRPESKVTDSVCNLVKVAKYMQESKDR